MAPNEQLFEAVGRNNNNTQQVQEALNAGADVNYVDSEGWSVLHWAANFCNIRIAKLLLRAGTHVNAQNESNETPLHIAVHYYILHAL